MTSTNPGDSDARAALETLGARFSPDFDAYASGKLPADRVRCVLCGTAPCSCQFCRAMHEASPYLAPGVFTSCGMRIDPKTGECPRGHSADLAATEDAEALAENCPACSHLWRLHGADGCGCKAYPAHSLTGEPCPCEHSAPLAE